MAICINKTVASLAKGRETEEGWVSNILRTIEINLKYTFLCLKRYSGSRIKYGMT
jgi:hypothetical protein